MTELILSKIKEIRDYTINSESLWRAEINKMTKMIDDLEDLVNKNDSKSSVSNRRELLIDFLDDVLMCQDEGATIVDREKYVDGYLGN
jgi:hypothetical protein